MPAKAPPDTAPDFRLLDSRGEATTLRSLLGRNLILYCYPAASTPGCTREAVDFEQALAELAERGYDVAGLSPDRPQALARFRDEQQLSFPLLSDPDHEVLAALGAWGEKRNYGRTYTGVIRSTFVLAPDRRVLAAYRNVRASGHVARLLRELP